MYCKAHTNIPFPKRSYLGKFDLQVFVGWHIFALAQGQTATLVNKLKIGQQQRLLLRLLHSWQYRAHHLRISRLDLNSRRPPLEASCAQELVTAEMTMVTGMTIDETSYHAPHMIEDTCRKASECRDERRGKMVHETCSYT